MLQQMTSELEIEHKRSEDLLLNILPASIAEKLKKGNQTIVDKIEDVTILFADLVGFTKLASKEDPEKLVKVLNQMFSIFDTLVERFKLEKIKTIGDAYFVAGGVPLPVENHTELTIKFALEMQKTIKDFRSMYYPELDIRIGMHCGPVMAGVLGTKKFTYDLWGDTVNIASRMESHGLPGRIQVSEKVYNRLKEHYNFEPARIVEVKGKGKMNTYLLSE
jgi:class 3 adenylate cyclase